MKTGLHHSWMDSTIVALDTETTGRYPLESQICEIAAIKWQSGKVVEHFHTLIKPDKPMSQEVIDIHHITNDMVAYSPKISEKIGEFYQFVGDAFVVGHHSPFDLGFLALEIEKRGLRLSQTPAFCSSLLSRLVFPDCTNHRLQTLVKELGLPGGEAHRALSDTQNCLQLTLKCFEKLGQEKTISDLLNIQKKKIIWQNFSMLALKSNPVINPILTAIQDECEIQITYMAGSQPGIPRTVKPIGIVRNPDIDFLVALPVGESISKRYYLEKISKAAL